MKKLLFISFLMISIPTFAENKEDIKVAITEPEEDKESFFDPALAFPDSLADNEISKICSYTCKQQNLQYLDYRIKPKQKCKCG